MPSNAFELVACIAIIGFMLYAIWRGGGSNPVGTGALQRQLNTLGSKVNGVEEKIGGCALKADLEGLRGELREMEARVASSGDILGLQGQIQALNATVSGTRDLVERAEASINRIEGYFLEKGVRGG